MSNLKPVAAQYLDPYHCPHCGSKGFLREKDGRCSFCSGRENGACIKCEEPCPGDVCEWCGQDQTLPDDTPVVNYSEADRKFSSVYSEKGDRDGRA